MAQEDWGMYMIMMSIRKQAVALQHDQLVEWHYYLSSTDTRESHWGPNFLSVWNPSLWPIEPIIPSIVNASQWLCSLWVQYVVECHPPPPLQTIVNTYIYATVTNIHVHIFIYFPPKNMIRYLALVLKNIPCWATTYKSHSVKHEDHCWVYQPFRG
jgi:hypothetical protein